MSTTGGSLLGQLAEPPSYVSLAMGLTMQCFVVFHIVGYSTCHWCHVMERESFESEEIAKILNENFVSVKVDREERPDVDKVYMTYIQVNDIECTISMQSCYYFQSKDPKNCKLPLVISLFHAFFKIM